MVAAKNFDFSRFSLGLNKLEDVMESRYEDLRFFRIIKPGNDDETVFECEQLLGSVFEMDLREAMLPS